MTKQTNTAGKPAKQTGRKIPDAQARARETGERQELAYGNGIVLRCYPSGLSTWFWRARVAGKPGRIKLGDYPALSLNDALAERTKLYKVRHETKRDPRKVATDKAEAIARETIRFHAEAWRNSQLHWSKPVSEAIERTLKLHIYPKIGNRPTAQIKPAEIVKLIADLNLRLPRVATSVRQILRKVFAWAIMDGAIGYNPLDLAAGSGMLPKTGSQQENQPAVLSIDLARIILRSIEGRPKVDPLLKLAHRLIALTGLRKMEALGAQWGELANADERKRHGDIWTIPAKRMKMKDDHIVAVSEPVREIFDAARRFHDLNGWARKDTPFIFVHQHMGKLRPFSAFALNDLYYNVLPSLDGFAPTQRRADRRRHQHSIHGWRATFSTAMVATRKYSEDVIERALAHKVLGRTAGAYNRYEYLTEKREVWEAWASMLLDETTVSPAELIGETAPRTNVVPMRRKGNRT
jgi:integrase